MACCPVITKNISTTKPAPPRIGPNTRITRPSTTAGLDTRGNRRKQPGQIIASSSYIGSHAGAIRLFPQGPRKLGFIVRFLGAGCGPLLLRKHFLEDSKHIRGRPLAYLPQLPHKTCRINSPNLVENNLSRLAFESAWHSRRITPPLRRHWGHDDCTDMVIHLVRRNHKAGSGFSDFAADRRVEIHQMNLKTIDHHSHSASSHDVGMCTSPSSRVSSAASAIF